MVRGLVIAVCSILIGIGGCVGFLSAFNNSGTEALGWIGGAAFFVGLLGLLVGAIIFIIGFFKWLIRATTMPPPPAE